MQIYKFRFLCIIAEIDVVLLIFLLGGGLYPGDMG